MPLPSKLAFFKKYNISEENFSKASISWEVLNKIYEEYDSLVENLELTAQAIVNKLNKAKEVHSVRYRIKNTEHLIEKIIRKKNEGVDITIDNYQEKITDMIGIRILHLFKEDWELIHEYIIEEFKLIEDPIAYVREGDNPEYLKYFELNKCEIKPHPLGYRSVHYLLESSLFQKKLITELQVRTIFEEGWSEVDHKIRYPYVKNNFILDRFLNILNRFAGSADEMSSFIKYLEPELKKQEEKIVDLENQIDKLKIDSAEKSEIKKGIRELDGVFSVGNDLASTVSFYTPQNLGILNTAASDLASAVSLYTPQNLGSLTTAASDLVSAVSLHSPQLKTFSRASIETLKNVSNISKPNISKNEFDEKNKK